MGGEDRASIEKRHQNADFMTIATHNGCVRCHRIKQHVVGPAWQKVAERYKDSPDARDFLIDKIKRGGAGNWDEVTSGAKMPPHQGLVTEEHLGKLVDYILALSRKDSEQ